MKKYLSLLMVLGVLITGVTKTEAITSNPNPVINGISGPQNLEIGKTGTWKIKAYDPQGGNLSYSVDWGDVYTTASDSRGQYLPIEMNLPQDSTFTHSYWEKGTFTPTFTVRNDNGGIATTSLSVNVGKAKKPLITVLSPNGGETLIRSQIQTISWKDNKVKDSYSNSKYYDINLVSVYPSCEYCLMPSQAPLSIAKKVSGYSFIWKIKKTISGINLRDGAYKIEVCRAGTRTCDLSDSYFKIVSPEINQAPIITDITGPTSLKAGQTGTWKVEAYDPNGGDLHYSVDWGDFSRKSCAVGAVCAELASLEAYPVDQSATMTHSYSKAGTYKITFTVRSDGGAVCVQAPCPAGGGMTTKTLIVKVGKPRTVPTTTVLPD